MAKLDSSHDDKPKDTAPRTRSIDNTPKPATTGIRTGDTFVATPTKNTGGNNVTRYSSGEPTRVDRSGDSGGTKSSYSVDSGIGAAVHSIDSQFQNGNGRSGLDQRPAGNTRYDVTGPGSGGIANLEDWNQLQHHAPSGRDVVGPGSGGYSNLTDWNDLQRERRNAEIAGRSTRPGEGTGGYASLEDWNRLQKPSIPDYGMGMAVQGAPDDFLTHAPPGPSFIDDLMEQNRINVAKRKAAGQPVWNPATGFEGLGDALVQTPKPGDNSMGILGAFDAIANPNRPPDGISTYTPPNIQQQLQQLNGGSPLPQRDDGLPINLGTLPVEDQVRYLHSQLSPEQAAGLPTNLDKFTPQQQVKYLTSMLTPSVPDYLGGADTGQPVVGKDLSQLAPNAPVVLPEGGVNPFDPNMFADAGSPYPASRETVPLPKPRPEHVVLPLGTPEPMGGAQPDDIWEGLRGPGEKVGEADPTLVTSDAKDAAALGEKEPSLWDHVVDGGMGLLSNNILGGIAKWILPDVWSGATDALKGLGDNFKFGSGTSRGPDPMLHNSQGEDTEAERAFRFKQRYAVDGNGGTAAAPGGPKPQPDPFTDFIDRNHNGIDDRLEPDAPGVHTHAPNERTVRFPNIPPYNPGRSDEFRYFGGNQYGNTLVPYAEGGEVGYRDGGIVQYLSAGGDVGALSRQDPRVAAIADAEDALAGHAEEPDKAIKKFVDLFGEEALKSLAAQVHGDGLSMRRGPRLIEGKGGPKSDAIPAKIDNVHEARLSDGEFVMPADAVLGAGNGDRAQGAAALQELAARLAGSKQAGKALNVERVG